MDVEGGEKKQPGEPDETASEATGGSEKEKDGAQEKGKGKAKEPQDKDKDEDQQQDSGVEEAKGGDKESVADPDGATTASKETEEEPAQKEGRGGEAEAEAEAAEEENEALKKAEAEAEAKAAACAEAPAEKRARRARVSLILKRLKEDAEDRRRSGRCVPPRGGEASAASHFLDTGSAGQDQERVIAVRGLHRKKKPGQGGSAAAASGGCAGSDPPETSRGEAAAAADWPPLGQRRLRRQLECAQKHAAELQQPGGGRRVRLATMLKADAAQAAKAGVATGNSSSAGWLEAKLARMRKAEDGEWAEWQRQVGEEAASNLGQAAGPPLPYGFVPRLAHRALGAYALIRTLSRPFRLTPASAVAFLRALSLRLRTPLLDAVHCELLRRVFCLLKGRSGGWAKSSGAQRELDWKYLDQVGGFMSELGFRGGGEGGFDSGEEVAVCFCGAWF